MNSIENYINNRVSDLMEDLSKQGIRGVDSVDVRDMVSEIRKEMGPFIADLRPATAESHPQDTLNTNILALLESALSEYNPEPEESGLYTQVLANIRNFNTKKNEG